MRDPCEVTNGEDENVSVVSDVPSKNIIHIKESAMRVPSVFKKLKFGACFAEDFVVPRLPAFLCKRTSS